MSIGDKASLDTAKILAGFGHDLMTGPALLSGAKSHFVGCRGDTVYVSPLAPEKKPEILPAYMHKTMGDDTATPPEAKMDQGVPLIGGRFGLAVVGRYAGHEGPLRADRIDRDYRREGRKADQFTCGYADSERLYSGRSAVHRIGDVLFYGCTADRQVFRAAFAGHPSRSAKTRHALRL